MILRRLLVVIAAVFACASAQGQDSDRRARLGAAMVAAEAGQLDLAQAAELSADPLYPWLRALVLRKQIQAATGAQVEAALKDIGDFPAGGWLRSAWLKELSTRGDWPAFRSAYRPGEDIALRCAWLRSRMDDPVESVTFDAEATQLWLTGKALPTACDAVLERMAASGLLDSRLRWQRIDLAIGQGDAGLVRAFAAGLDSEGAALASSYADYLAGATPPMVAWPDDARSRQVRTMGLMRLARRDPEGARQALLAAPATALDAVQRGRVSYEIALWTVASYLPGSAQRLNEVPAAAYDERLHEWRVREALSRADDAAALAAIGRMGATQRDDSRWLYFEARLRERLGQGAAARELYVRSAQNADFHGWLAADRLQQPYTLCALEPPREQALAASVSANAGLGRALDLFALDRADLAAREWAAAVKPMSHGQRRIAVQRAIAEGWFDRAVFGMGAAPEDQQHYSLRFPLHHEADIRAQSRNNDLDPAWVAAQTRAESSFMPKARSGADARGLMQLLPGTGQLTALRLGLPWSGGDSLYEPVTNLTLGTAYLRQMLDRFSGLPYLAIAAYNAGPAPVDRWRAARAQLEPDFFIESIPYKETREYVARVLAFSVVYDWRLNGNAAPLTYRMLGLREPSGQRRAFACNAPTNLAEK